MSEKRNLSLGVRLLIHNNFKVLIGASFQSYPNNKLFVEILGDLLPQENF